MNFLRSFALVAAIGVRADDVCQRRRLGGSDRMISSVVVLNNIDSDLFNIDKLAHVRNAASFSPANPSPRNRRRETVAANPSPRDRRRPP